jgi:aldehyde dehydrogenase
LKDQKSKKNTTTFIGGKWVAPASGEYFDNISPIDGKAFSKAARGNKEDIEKGFGCSTCSISFLVQKLLQLKKSRILNKNRRCN